MRSIARYPEGDVGFDAVEALYRRTLARESGSIDFVRPEHTLALQTAPLRDGLARVSAGMVLAIDVTRERATEATLRKSEQIYRAIVENLLSGGVMMASRSHHYVSEDGPVIQDILRQTNLGNLVGRSITEVASEGNREVLRSSDERAFHPVSAVTRRSSASDART